MSINWKQAKEEILGTEMYMKLIDGKWCMLRQGEGTIYYDAPTKKALISAYYHRDFKSSRTPLQRQG